MYGAFIGDVIGSTYEFSEIKRSDFELFPRGSLFTDDSILTAAIADALMDYFSCGGDLPQLLTAALRSYAIPAPWAATGCAFSAGSEATNQSRTTAAATARPCVSLPVR